MVTRLSGSVVLPEKILQNLIDGLLDVFIITIHVHVCKLTLFFIVVSFEGLAKRRYLHLSLVCLLINILIFLKRKNRYISH